MVHVRTISRDLSNLLDLRSVPDISRNGLQVNANNTVRRIGLAVDASMDTFKAARQKKCDMIIVHHGIKWSGVSDEAGIQGRRERFLRENGISLFAAHLPLDRHDTYGNNIRLANLLGLQECKRFGGLGALKIGYKGTYGRPVSAASMIRLLDSSLKTRSVLLRGGKHAIRSVGVVSGSGTSTLGQAYLEGADCLVTGEGPHRIHHEAKELGVHVILSGHYQTETVGVASLGPYLDRRFG